MVEILNNKRVVTGLLMSMAGLMVLAVVMEPKLQRKWQEKQLAAVVTAIEKSAESSTKDWPKIDLLAKAAIVYDVQDDSVLYAKSPDTPMPLASLTKLVTALVASTELEPDAKLLVSKTALETDGESGLVAGDVWRYEDLSDYMLAVSSNDAATVLASNSLSKNDFILKMNKEVSRLGLSSVRLYNESGLDLSQDMAGAFGSARDVSLLLAYISIYSPDMLEATTASEFTSVSDTGRLYTAKNTDKIVDKIPGLIGGKTGFTDLAGGNLAVILDTGVGHYVAIVVLGSTKEGRFTDVLKLVNEVF